MTRIPDLNFQRPFSDAVPDGGDLVNVVYNVILALRRAFIGILFDLINVAINLEAYNQSNYFWVLNVRRKVYCAEKCEFKTKKINYGYGYCIIYYFIINLFKILYLYKSKIIDNI